MCMFVLPGVVHLFCIVLNGLLARLEWLTFLLRSLWSHQLWPGVPITLAIGSFSVILSKGIPKEALASETLKHNWQRTDVNQHWRTSLDITVNGAFLQEIKRKWKCLDLTQRYVSSTFIKSSCCTGWRLLLMSYCAGVWVYSACKVIFSRTLRVFPAAQSSSQLIISGPDKNTAPCYYKCLNVMKHNALLFPRSDHH